MKQHQFSRIASFATIKSSRAITSTKCQLPPKQRNFVWTRALDNAAPGSGRDPTRFLAKYWSIGTTRGSHKIPRDKKATRQKNVADLNATDLVRRDTKVLVTKTRYTVHTCTHIYSYRHVCVRIRTYVHVYKYIYTQGLHLHNNVLKIAAVPIYNCSNKLT